MVLLTSRIFTLALALLLVLAGLAGVVMALGQTARVAAQPLTVFVVANVNDSGPGSLRQAILDANASSGVDDIVFNILGCTAATPCVISPLTLLPAVTDPVRIMGPGMDSLVIDANNAFRVFNIAPVPVIITDLTVQNGVTTGRGAGIRTFGPLTLARVRLLGNQAEDDGGGVFAAGPLTVNDSVFAHNAARHGGGLYGESGLTITNSQFNNNTADSSGGGAYGNEGVSVTGGRFEENITNYAGGGLFADDAVILTGTVFISNTASWGGGGLNATNTVQVSQGWFENNESRYGGGIYVRDALTLTNTTFLNNKAIDYGYGGGVFTWETIHATQVRFEGNVAIEHGGGIYALGNVNLIDTSFIGNHALDGRGGGIIVPALILASGPTGGERTVLLTRTQFISNTASLLGGGLFAYGPVQITHGWFENNHSVYGGGGLSAVGDLILEDTSFVGNTAVSGYGGGVNSYGDVQVNGGLFEGNSSRVGGGLYVDGYVDEFTESVLVIDSSAFIANEADVGGGVAYESGSGLVVNSLFARNRGYSAGAALALESAGVVEVQHTTVVGETGQSEVGIVLGYGTLLLENTIVVQYDVGILNFSGNLYQNYNLFYQNGLNIVGSFSGGSDNVSGDPKFVAPQNGDFHIGAGSAALNAGVDAGVTVDFEGDSRPLGGGFDIGYNEADQILGLALSYTPSPTATVQAPVLFTATVSGGSNVTYSWDFGDGSPAVSGNPVSHQYPAPGLYLVTVTATNSSGSLTTSVEIEVVPGEITLPENWLYLPVILK